jgi:hypothetical protein
MSFKVGELLTPDSVGDMGQQNKSAVDIDGGDISGTAITLQSYSVASAPAATLGRLIHVTNGDGGSECAAIGDGTYFRVIAMGSTIST